MEKTYISITITHYNSTKVNLKPAVHYYLNDGVNPPVSEFNKLTAEEANVLMWKLVKQGGSNTTETNWFDPSICTRRVMFWGTP